MWSIRRAAVLAAGILLIAGGTARAQTLEAKIPFPFVVHGKTLPAGQYRIERDARDDGLISIEGEHGTHDAVFVLTEPAAGHDPSAPKAALTFRRVENKYVLDDIWDRRDSGREIVPSR